MEKINKNKLSKNVIFNLVLFGFMGQVAWAVENNYFNTFLFNVIGGSSQDIADMVAWSAVVAVLTTLVMGTLSDKLNRRKIFVSLGYVFWGVTVMAFAFISRENVSAVLGITDEARVKLLTINLVIVMDCLMTFMGSTSNDAAFNAWITDVTNEKNRAKTESILALLPVFAMVIVTVAFGALATSFGYPACFIGLGALVVVCGIIGFFTVKDSLSGVKQESGYWGDLIYGFRPSVIKKNKDLYLALASAGFFSIATQVFFPYIFIYLQHRLGFDFNTIGEFLTLPVIIGAAVVLVGAVVGLILLGGLIDKVGKSVFVFPTVIIFVVGLAACSFSKTMLPFAISALPTLAGYGLLMIILNAAVRDFTPEDKVGQFQGIRMIFYVLLPMIIGPRVGSFVTDRFADGTYTNDYGEVVNIPVSEIYFAAAVIALFIFIPIIFLRKTWKQKELESKNSD